MSPGRALIGLWSQPAGQIATCELEVERIRSAMPRAQELTGDAAEALEDAATR